MNKEENRVMDSMEIFEASIGQHVSNENVREMNETITSKLFYLQSIIIALIMEIFLLIIFQNLYSEEGVTLGVGGSVLKGIIHVLLTLYMHVLHIINEAGHTKALSAFFGNRLSSNGGYSLAICGFVQSSIVEKINFSSVLNFKSKIKKLTSRLSILYAVYFLNLILTVITASEIYVSIPKKATGTRNCDVYHQNGEQVERNEPSLEKMMGNAEFIFGTSLGILTSETVAPNSTFIFPPILIDSAVNGAEIHGNGFTADIKSSCSCSSSSSQADLIDAGAPVAAVSEMLSKYLNLKSLPGWVNHINHDNSYEGTIEIVTFLSGTIACGGADYNSPRVPVCTSTVDNHYHAIGASMSYMNDGNPERNTPNMASIQEKSIKANMTW